jgi:stage II sporulation protein M
MAAACIKWRYQLSFNNELVFVKTIRTYISISIFIFAIASLMGYSAASENSEIATELMKELEVLKWIMELPSIMIMLVIFLKNLLACTISIFLGLGLGIIPLLVILSNGFLLGAVSYGVIQKEGFAFLLAGILPHGIVELPTVMLSTALGFRLGYLLAISILGEKANIGDEIKIATIVLFRWIIPLLFLAAFIETFITPIIISVVK